MKPESLKLLNKLIKAEQELVKVNKGIVKDFKDFEWLGKYQGRIAERHLRALEEIKELEKIKKEENSTLDSIW